MAKAAKIIFCSNQNFRKWRSNPRIYIIALLLIGYLSLLVRPIAHFSNAAQVPAEPWVFPFLASHPYSLFIIMLGIILLFCDAPFIDAHQPYIIIRSGRKDWVFGQILYIMLASAVYCLFILLVSATLLLPHLGFSSEWGKVLGTLAQTDAGAQFGMFFTIDYRLMVDYTPFHAVALSFLLMYLVCMFLGLLMFVVNMNFRRGIGGILAAGLTFLSYFVHEVWIDALYYLSPVSWASLGSIGTRPGSIYPSMTYVFSVLAGLILICIVLAQLSFRRNDVDVLPPV